eukprot:3038884-Prymnesium_polylepis.1
MAPALLCRTWQPGRMVPAPSPSSTANAAAAAAATFTSNRTRLSRWMARSPPKRRSRAAIARRLLLRL